jgi:hypothetical protein
MSRDEDAKDLRLFDNRTIERNIRKGLITRKDYEKHLKNLEDVTDKIAPKDAPASNIAPSAPRPVEYQAAPIIAIPPAPGSAELRMDDDIDDDEDEDEDDDIEELDDDDLEPAPTNGTSEDPPKT